MSRQDAALGCGARRQEEVKAALVLSTLVLNQVTIDDTSRGRVDQATSGPLDEEALGDPLVDHHDCDLGFHTLRVDSLDRVLQLRDLLSENLVPLSVADTVTVDHERRGELTLVVELEGPDSVLDASLHVSFDDLLTLLLDDVVAVILRHL